MKNLVTSSSSKKRSLNSERCLKPTIKISVLLTSKTRSVITSASSSTSWPKISSTWDSARVKTRRPLRNSTEMSFSSECYSLVTRESEWLRRWSRSQTQGRHNLWSGVSTLTWLTFEDWSSWCRTWSSCFKKRTYSLKFKAKRTSWKWARSNVSLNGQLE